MKVWKRGERTREGHERRLVTGLWVWVPVDEISAEGEIEGGGRKVEPARVPKSRVECESRVPSPATPATPEFKVES